MQELALELGYRMFATCEEADGSGFGGFGVGLDVVGG
jgi:hypothetical protein